MTTTHDNAPATPESRFELEKQIIAYLKDNPDFLIRHPEALANVDMPSRWEGEEGVVDMQQVMLERLRGEIENLSSCAQDVIETSRSNMSSQTRVHAAVLALLGARNMEQLARIIQDDLPLLLDVDVATIGFSRSNIVVTALNSDSVLRFEPDFIVSILGENADTRLVSEMRDDGTLFGPGAGLVRSAGIARLRRGLDVPEGVLALGSRTEGMFNPGQGSDLLNFVARVVERLTHRFLEPEM